MNRIVKEGISPAECLLGLCYLVRRSVFSGRADLPDQIIQFVCMMIVVIIVIGKKGQDLIDPASTAVRMRMVMGMFMRMVMMAVCGHPVTSLDKRMNAAGRSCAA